MLQGPRPDFANSRISQTFWPRTPLQPNNQPINQPTDRPVDRSIAQSIYQLSNKVNEVLIN